MNKTCPVDGCNAKWDFLKNPSAPYVTHLIMSHIIETHTLVEVNDNNC